MNKAILLCIVLAQFLPAPRCARAEPKANSQSTSKSAVATSDSNRAWRAATYRGLTMGRSKVAEMRKVFGAPKRTEVFNAGKSNAEVRYEYDVTLEFPGTLMVVVDRRSKTIRQIDIQPKDLKQEEVIKHFGLDYVITRYDFDLCLGDEESAQVFESPTGSIIQVEYR